MVLYTLIRIVSTQFSSKHPLSSWKIALEVESLLVKYANAVLMPEMALTKQAVGCAKGRREDETFRQEQLRRRNIKQGSCGCRLEGRSFLILNLPALVFSTDWEGALEFLLEGTTVYYTVVVSSSSIVTLYSTIPLQFLRNKANQRHYVKGSGDLILETPTFRFPANPDILRPCVSASIYLDNPTRKSRRLPQTIIKPAEL